MDAKALTVRLAASQAEELEMVAHADGVPVSEAIREAISEHIARRRKDKAFQERLKASLERNKEILDRLANA